MRVAIDISPLSSGHSGRGIGIYTKELVSALQTYEPNHTYTLVTGKIDIQNVDLIHYPYFDPFFLTLPLRKMKPTVVTVHDLIPLVFPDKFPKGVRGAIKWQIQKASLLNVTRIITDSDASKQDVAKITGFDLKKIDRIYLAPSAVYSRVTVATRLSEIAKKYALPKKFMLYVGDVNWNKNIPGLLRAVAKVSVSLVLVGKAFLDANLKETKEINAFIATLEMDKRVIKLGFVSDEDLACIYSLATCLVQPSFYEGFGLPILEAFSCGCPVVAAGNSSILEIMGPATNVSADSSDDIAHGIEHVLGMSVKERVSLQQKQFIWASQFTWEKTAHETVLSYERSI